MPSARRARRRRGGARAARPASRPTLERRSNKSRAARRTVMTDPTSDVSHVPPASAREALRLALVGLAAEDMPLARLTEQQALRAPRPVARGFRVRIDGHARNSAALLSAP